MGLSTVYALLHRLGFSWLSPRPRNPKQLEEEKQKFKKETLKKLKSFHQENPSTPIEIWMQDETRIGRHGILHRTWGKRGERLETDKQTEYEWVYMYGATNPFQGKGTALLLPEANTYGMNLFLQNISEQVAPNAHAFVILDRAAWHCAKALQIPTNIELLHLPAYSPDLNPIEQVWGYLKKLFLSNRVYESYDHLLDGLTEAWNWFQEQPTLISSLTNIKWLSQLSFL